MDAIVRQERGETDSKEEGGGEKCKLGRDGKTVRESLWL